MRIFGKRDPVHAETPGENRFRPLKREHIINPVLYLEYESLNEASKILNYSRVILSNGWFVVGIVLLIVALIAQLSMFTWADLTYVLPMTAGSYALTAILGKFFLGETVTAARWAGVVLISFGVILVAETPSWTHDAPPPEEEP